MKITTREKKKFELFAFMNNASTFDLFNDMSKNGIDIQKTSNKEAVNRIITNDDVVIVKVDDDNKATIVEVIDKKQFEENYESTLIESINSKFKENEDKDDYRSTHSKYDNQSSRSQSRHQDNESSQGNTSQEPSIEEMIEGIGRMFGGTIYTNGKRKRDIDEQVDKAKDKARDNAKKGIDVMIDVLNKSKDRL